MNFFLPLALGAAICSAAPQLVFPTPSLTTIGEVWGPSVCTQDNLYRMFMDPRYVSSAVTFCNTYYTSTYVSTIAPTTTVTALTTAIVKTSFYITTVTMRMTSIKGHAPVPTTTIYIAPNVKRDANQNSNPLAGCPTQATTYGGVRISSACSCILLFPTVVSSMASFPTATITISSLIKYTIPGTTTKTATVVTTILGAPTATATSTAYAPLINQLPPSQKPPVVAAYCIAGIVQGNYNYNNFNTDCGFSFIGNPEIHGSSTVDTYMDCATACDTIDICHTFSFILVAGTGDNCFLLGNLNQNLGVADSNVDSGMLT